MLIDAERDGALKRMDNLSRAISVTRHGQAHSDEIFESSQERVSTAKWILGAACSYTSLSLEQWTLSGGTEAWRSDHRAKQPQGRRNELGG